MGAPWNTAPPESLEIGGDGYAIRSDYRVALDVLEALSAPDLSQEEAAYAAMVILFPCFEDIPPEHYREALGKMSWYLDGGAEPAKHKRSPRLMDWEQDFQYIVGPVNRILGAEIRAVKQDEETGRGLHWWTFLAAFQEIGDGTFAQIVHIRNQKARGKKLDKADQEWYRQHRHLVDFKMKYTDQDMEDIKKWGGMQ